MAAQNGDNDKNVTRGLLVQSCGQIFKMFIKFFRRVVDVGKAGKGDEGGGIIYHVVNIIYFYCYLYYH